MHTKDELEAFEEVPVLTIGMSQIQACGHIDTVLHHEAVIHCSPNQLYATLHAMMAAIRRCFPGVALEVGAVSTTIEDDISQGEKKETVN